MRIPAPLKRHNDQRCSDAAQRRVAEAEAALVIILNVVPQSDYALAVLSRWEHALRLRIDNPECSLAELAVAYGGTKDQYAAELRRAIDRAKAVGEQ